MAPCLFVCPLEEALFSLLHKEKCKRASSPRRHKFHIIRPGPEGPGLIHSTMPPFQIEPALLGFDLAFFM